MLTLGIVAAFMAACRHYAWGFVGVWNGIAVFFFVRAVQSGVRVVGAHMLGRGSSPEEQRLMEMGESMASGVEEEGGVDVVSSSAEGDSEEEGSGEVEGAGNGLAQVPGEADIPVGEVDPEVDPEVLDLRELDPGRTERP